MIDRLLQIVLWVSVAAIMGYALIIAVYGGACIGEDWKDHPDLCTFIHENF